LKPFAIIGAGSAGMSAAYKLTEAGIQVEVFEATSDIGGLARSISLWGQTVDIGPHRFFSKDKKINNFWLQVAGKDYKMVNRLTRIYYNKRFFAYPLKPFNALWNMGPVNAVLCFLSYLRQLILPSFAPAERTTFEAWVVTRFGWMLYKMFFKSYSEKLWGIPCTELDADFAAQRIKKFSLGQALKNALGLTRRKHNTLVDKFAYPLQGTGSIYKKMADYVEASGGKIHKNCPVKKVIVENNQAKGVVTAKGERKDFAGVISTMPLTDLLQGMDDLPAGLRKKLSLLTYRNTVLVYLEIDAVDLFPDNWLYIHAGELQVGRITNFRNWVPEINNNKKTTIIAMEYWCNESDPLWTQDDNITIDTGKKEFYQTGLLQKANIINTHLVKLHRCYPVYKTGYKDHLAPLITYLKKIKGLLPIGRYGSFKYNNQDHSILMGLLAADNIINNSGHDLWHINTDYENYQEESTISKVMADKG